MFAYPFAYQWYKKAYLRPEAPIIASTWSVTPRPKMALEWPESTRPRGITTQDPTSPYKNIQNKNTAEDFNI